MAPYSNGYGYGYPPPSSSKPSTTALYSDFRSRTNDFQSICDDIGSTGMNIGRRIWAYWNTRGRHGASNIAMRSLYQLRRNLSSRRLLSFPHLLVGIWVLILLWGERWVFSTRVNSCDWDHWENWPGGATPHHLIFVADPQIIDPHSYPGRPWPLNPLTVTITDNYLRRSYTRLQNQLQPDTVMFLGDLFDGGREWKTAQGEFEEPKWAKAHRPADEQKYVKQWRRKYGEEFWLSEYERFGKIFFDNWKLGGTAPGRWQRGRKLISSLPGNHDLGFGSEVKVPVRQRFAAFFGELNRVDVVGNHTFVSVDTVSLSAGTSDEVGKYDIKSIYEPADEFLKEVKAEKRRAVARELKFWRGEVEDLTFEHTVEELKDADFSNLPTADKGENAPELPTVLLSHVPLYRDPGTPCGPMREHWPPAKPPKGQTGPVIPDDRNAIRVAKGYQYQNVLSDADSIKLVKSIGNIKYAFSGDDHDYCELVHNEQKENVHEITVKSLSMAMGVPTPGFLMVSLYNPIDANGNPLPGAPKQTLQTHLCLLPKQLSTYTTYAALGIITLLVLSVRAFLVPVLKLQPFAFDATPGPDNSVILPVFKAKVEIDLDDSHGDPFSTTSSTSSSRLGSGRFSARSRGESLSSGNGLITQARNPSPNPRGKDKWGWAAGQGPRIQIRKDVLYDGGKSRGMTWRAASRPRSSLQLVFRETWTTVWRVVWMVLAVFAYITHKG